MEQEFLANHKISWSLIGYAIAHYRDRSYQYIEVPWVVPRTITELTLPVDARPFPVSETSFDKKNVTQLIELDWIGSAEQSFLWLAQKNELYVGNSCKFMACTPCFRDDKRDQLHQKTFMKVELFSTNPEDCDKIFEDAWGFFNLYGMSDCRECGKSGHSNLKKIKTELGYDISLNGIEIGSYGIRETPFGKFAYGTGLAEPRFSQALDQ